MTIPENIYVTLRNNYLPKKIVAVFILESPPEGHGYFYDPNGKTHEILFRAFMKIISCLPKNKHEGLQKLQNKGFLLVNPIYTPVNKLPDKIADKMILDNYSCFINDLSSLINKEVPIILIKSNILKLLEDKLVSDGFNVLNKGMLVPFPLHYHAESFHKKVLLLLEKINYSDK